MLIALGVGATELELPVAGMVASLLAAFVCVASGVRYLRMRLVVNSSGLRVRNFASSWEANWIEIERFEGPAPQYSREGFRHPGIAVHFRDGRREHIGLFAPARYNLADFADDVVVAGLARLRAHPMVGCTARSRGDVATRDRCRCRRRGTCR